MPVNLRPYGARHYQCRYIIIIVVRQRRFVSAQSTQSLLLLLLLLPGPIIIIIIIIIIITIIAPLKARPGTVTDEATPLSPLPLQEYPVRLSPCLLCLRPKRGGH